MGTGLDLEPVRAAFLAETDEDLQTVEQALLLLEKTPGDREGIATVFRKFHTLKGNASALGLERLGALAHRVEDLLDRLRSGKEPVTAEVVTFLLHAVDAVRGCLPAAAAGHDEITAAAEALQAQVVEGRLEAASPSAGRPGAAEPEPAAEASRTLRVEVSRLDTLLSVAAEIAVARGRLGLLIAQQGTPEIAAAYQGLERQLAQMHRCVSEVRMVPIAPLLRRYDRVVRDLAREQGKRAELVVSGEDVEADNSVLEQLRAPLTHMVRNAVDHGLEAPAAREACGKDPSGHLWLTARQEGSEVVIEVEDDGAGLDRRRITERARALGIETEGLSPREVDRLIFSQGLSTSGYVTGTSGRGVGLDVVLRHVDALGGSVAVESEAGKRTRFTLRMPVTLAAIEGLLARLGESAVVIPMAGVVRCVDLPAEAPGDGRDGVLSVDGHAVPFARLRETFCPGGRAADAGEAVREVAVIVEKGHERFGLAVDQLVGRAQVVVKAPGRFFKGLPAVSGLTILGDGRVAPVVNVAGLLQQHQRRAAAAAAERRP